MKEFNIVGEYNNLRMRNERHAERERERERERHQK